MGKINILQPDVFNMISAGEVVERPASVVKELVENSIDAGATVIDVTVSEGGIRRISVSDNGGGIAKEDMRAAFLPHATSKLKEISDLDTVSTLGFRGEALASIASVSEVTAISRAIGAETAAEITQSGADFISSAPQEETTYRAGSGTLTYIPAPQEGGAAQIVFDNAEIESGAYVNYWSENRSYAAVAARLYELADQLQRLGAPVLICPAVTATAR